jgi:hypothetical protein
MSSLLHKGKGAGIGDSEIRGSVLVALAAIIVSGLLLLSAPAFADANDGEYLGFKLGEKFAAPRGAIARQHITGALSYSIDPEHRHQHMGSLALYVSPKSSIIGSIFGEWYFSSERSARQFADRYMLTLEEKYGHWRRRRSTLTNGDYQLWVDLEEKPPVVEHWPSAKTVRVSVALIFAPESARRKEWLAMVASEAGGAGPLSAQR